MAKMEKVNCGLIMPISSIDGCSAEHWVEVKNIVTEAIGSIEEYSFTVNLVSDADEVGVIQKRIVQNIYSSDLVVCDVSCKNPNVMFELGMRLAFDKATIIIKDDITNYSFDTGIIEHLTYPRDLRFGRIVSFKEKLAEKSKATYEKFIKDPDHSIFLKNFGKFHVANLSEDVVSSDKLVLEMLTDMQHEMSMIRRKVQPTSRTRTKSSVINTMRRGIKNWANKNNCEINSLIGDDQFYDYIEDRINAQDHFSSQQDFRESLENQLEKLQV